MKRWTKVSVKWVYYVLWAVFVNAVVMWLINPLVQDFAVLGVVSVTLLIVVWLSSIPVTERRNFVAYTLFSLFVGQGLSNVLFYPFARKLIFGTVMCLGLLAIAYLFTRIRLAVLLTTVVVLVGANAWLPISEWPFLTHFKVSDYNQFSLVPSDIAALPLVPVKTSNGGHVIVTLDRTPSSTASLLQEANQATTTPDALSNVLRSYQNRYRLVEIKQAPNGRFETVKPSAAVLAEVNPLKLTNSFFPFTEAHWQVENGQVLQYMGPAESTFRATQLAIEPANYAANVVAFAQATARSEQIDWNNALGTLNVSPVKPNLQIVNGLLQGQVDGRTISVHVDGQTVGPEGAFTATSTREVLVQGADVLQIVNLSVGEGQIVASYHASQTLQLTSDLVVGPLDNSGTDAIFVNASPAYILRASPQGRLEPVYVAPNSSLRFEDSVRFPGDPSPEILTNDPSAMRDTPTRYFTSYSYRQHSGQMGELVRNWRVFRTNVVNVQSVQFHANGPTYVLAGIYTSGQYVVLMRHHLPVVPLSIVLLGLCIVGGWIVKWRQRGGTERA